MYSHAGGELILSKITHLQILNKMRLIIFTNRDLASNYNLNLLLPKLSKYVVQIFFSDKVGGKRTALPKALKELKFFEQTLPYEFLFPQFEENPMREKAGKLLTFKELSERYQIPIVSLNEVKSAESLEMIAALQPDLVLSVRYGKIFGREFLKIPKLGTINLHSGKLPNYRGVLAVFRALRNGDENVYATLHYIEDATIDTGGIIGFSKVKVDTKRALLYHILEIYRASVELVVNAVAQIAEGHFPLTTPQIAENAQYFSFPTQSEIVEFEARGWQFVDVEEYADFMKQYA